MLFTASLAFGAILFGVFGIFYSVYAMYSATTSLARPKICEKLRDLCRFLAAVGVINLAVVAVPLYLLTPKTCLDIALSSILGVSAGGLMAASVVLAFKYMH